MFVSRSGGDSPARVEVRARRQIRDSAAVQDELDSVTDLHTTHVPSNESQTVVSAVEMDSDATAAGVPSGHRRSAMA